MWSTFIKQEIPFLWKVGQFLEIWYLFHCLELLPPIEVQLCVDWLVGASFRVDQIWAVHRPAQHSMKGEIRQLGFAPHLWWTVGPMLSTSSEWFIYSHECLSLYQWLIAWQSIRLPVESICGPSAILKQQILSCVHMDSIASDAHGLTVISSSKCPVQGPKLLELITWESVSCLKAVKFLRATGSLMLVEKI